MPSESFCNCQKVLKMTKRPMCQDTFSVFQQHTNSFKEKSNLIWTVLLAGHLKFAVMLVADSLTWPHYESFLFFKLLSSSSSPLSSQPEFLFVWWLREPHVSWSPSGKALVSLLWLTASPSWAHFLLLVEASVLAAGGSHCAWGLWLFTAAPLAGGCCPILVGSWCLPGEPGSPERGAAPGYWGLEGCSSLRHFPLASQPKPILLSSRGSRSQSWMGGLSGSFAVTVTVASLESEGEGYREEAIDILANSLSSLLLGTPPWGLDTSGAIAGGWVRLLCSTGLSFRIFTASCL